MRPSLDDCPAISIARLRAAGVITADTTSFRVEIAGRGQDVAVVLQKFPNGGSWSYFRCPSCGHRVRTLRLVGERFACWRFGCSGLWPRVMLGDKAGRIERLMARLYSGQAARLHPRPGRMVDRRERLEASLRRALLVEREKRLKGWRRCCAEAQRDLRG